MLTSTQTVWTCLGILACLGLGVRWTRRWWDAQQQVVTLIEQKRQAWR